MTTIYDVSRYKGLTINRAPFSDDSGYTYWKTRLMVFLKCEANEVWDVVEEDPYILKKTVNRVQKPKPKEEWTDYD